MGSPFADEAYRAGDVLHTECSCCEHAAKRTETLRASIEYAVKMIRDGYPGETMLELDRVLVCLNEWCNEHGEPPSHRFAKALDDEIAF